MNTYHRIQAAAVRLAQEGGLVNVTRDKVARSTEIAPSLVNHYFDSMDILRSRVMEVAVDTEDAELLKCGIVASHPIALAAPLKLRKQALALLSRQVMEG